MHGNLTLCLTNALSLFFLIIQFDGVWGPVCGSTAVSFPSWLYWAQCRLSGLLQRTNFTTITGETRCVCLRGSYCQLLMSDFELPACQVQVGKFTHTAVKCYVKTTGKKKTTTSNLFAAGKCSTCSVWTKCSYQPNIMQLSLTKSAFHKHLTSKFWIQPSSDFRLSQHNKCSPSRPSD